MVRIESGTGVGGDDVSVCGDIIVVVAVGVFHFRLRGCGGQEGGVVD